MSEPLAQRVTSSGLARIAVARASAASLMAAGVSSIPRFFASFMTNLRVSVRTSGSTSVSSRISSALSNLRATRRASIKSRSEGLEYSFCPTTTLTAPARTSAATPTRTAFGSQP